MPAIVDVLKEKLNVTTGQTIAEVLKSGEISGGGSGSGDGGSSADNVFHINAKVTPTQSGLNVELTDDNSNSLDFNGIMSGIGTDLNNLKHLVATCSFYDSNNILRIFGEIPLALTLTSSGITVITGSMLLTINASEMTFGVLSISMPQYGGAKFYFRTVSTTDGGY